MEISPKSSSMRQMVPNVCFLFCKERKKHKRLQKDLAQQYNLQILNLDAAKTDQFVNIVQRTTRITGQIIFTAKCPLNTLQDFQMLCGAKSPKTADRQVLSYIPPHIPRAAATLLLGREVSSYKILANASEYFPSERSISAKAFS